MNYAYMCICIFLQVHCFIGLFYSRFVLVVSIVFTVEVYVIELRLSERISQIVSRSVGQ